MEKEVTVKLIKDSEGNYALNVTPLTITVSPRVEDEVESNEPVRVKWVLIEDPENPGFPNAKQLTASFKATSTPFSVPTSGPPPSATESYSTPAGATGAEVASNRVQDTSVGQDENAISLYGYSISVQTNDGKTITLDPHVRVRRRSISRGHSDI